MQRIIVNFQFLFLAMLQYLKSEHFSTSNYAAGLSSRDHWFANCDSWRLEHSCILHTMRRFKIEINSSTSIAVSWLLAVFGFDYREKAKVIIDSSDEETLMKIISKNRWNLNKEIDEVPKPMLI